jgi:hypothetical protein
VVDDRTWPQKARVIRAMIDAKSGVVREMYEKLWSLANSERMARESTAHF